MPHLRCVVAQEARGWRPHHSPEQTPVPPLDGADQPAEPGQEPRYLVHVAQAPRRLPRPVAPQAQPEQPRHACWALRSPHPQPPSASSRQAPPAARRGHLAACLSRPLHRCCAGCAVRGAADLNHQCRSDRLPLSHPPAGRLPAAAQRQRPLRPRWACHQSQPPAWPVLAPLPPQQARRHQTGLALAAVRQARRRLPLTAHAWLAQVAAVLVAMPP